jgi:hypothetical protein
LGSARRGAHWNEGPTGRPADIHPKSRHQNVYDKSRQINRVIAPLKLDNRAKSRHDYLGIAP